MIGGGPVDAGSGGFQVELRMPSPGLTKELIPKTDLYLSSSSDATSVYRIVAAHRPRVVLYEDSNDNGRLDLRQNGTTGTDRVLAIDDDYYTMAAVLDMERLLRELPATLVDLYYSATDGRFTAFVPTMGTTDYLYLGEKGFEYSFSLDDGGRPLASLQCVRSVSVVSRVSSPSVVLDTSLDTDLCGLDYSNCRSQELEKVVPPAVTSIRSCGLQRQATCRQRGALEALAVSETRSQCARCECSSEQKLEVFIADHQAVPSWWPCGEQVDFCASEASLATFPVACIRNEGGSGN